MDDLKSFKQVVSNLAELAKGLTLKQKLTLAAGVVIVAATLFAFVAMVNKPEMKTLYSGMRAEEARALGARLAAKNIKYEVSPDGTRIDVPAEQLDAARVEVVSQGAPSSGRMGFEIFDKPNWGATDFSDKVNYQRALEAELERTLQSLSEIESARVHLVLPAESLFVREEREGKASVTVKFRAGDYRPEILQLISKLVAGSVDRLRPENVAVIDSETNRSLTLAGRADGNGSLEKQLSETLTKVIEPVVGADRVRTTVRIEYDPTSGEEQQEIYDPNTAVALSVQKTEERSGAGAYSGVPGTASNISGSSTTQLPARTDDGSQSSFSKSENSTYVVNKTVRHTLVPAGRVDRISAAIVIDDAVQSSGQGAQKTETRRKRSPEEIKQIEEIAKAAIGIDPNRGDVLSVQNISFEHPVSDPAPAPTRLEKTRDIVRNNSSLLRYVFLALLFIAVYALLLRPVKKQAVMAFRQIGHPFAGKPSVASAAHARNLEGATIDSVQVPAETAHAANLKRQLLEKVKAEPVAASRLVQSWIRQGDAQ